MSARLLFNVYRHKWWSKRQTHTHKHTHIKRKKVRIKPNKTEVKILHSSHDSQLSRVTSLSTFSTDLRLQSVWIGVDLSLFIFKLADYRSFLPHRWSISAFLVFMFWDRHLESIYFEKYFFCATNQQLVPFNKLRPTSKKT